MVRNEQGAVVVDGATLAAGAKLHISFARGWAKAEVKASGRDD
jgi:exonuclease VII large subunit